MAQMDADGAIALRSFIKLTETKIELESMTETTLFVCSLCRFSQVEASRDGVSGGEYLIDQLRAELATSDLPVNLQPLRCMAGCSHPCNVSLAAPNKLTFILSGLSPTDSVTALSQFCQQYANCPDGKVPYKERPKAVRDATAFVLPPLPTPSETKKNGRAASV